MKKLYFLCFLICLLLFLSACVLTGCGNGQHDSSPENSELSTGKISDREEPDSDRKASPSDPAPDTSFDTKPAFPRAKPFIDDTGKSMQRHGDYLYSYYDGRLMRTHKEDGETSLLYQTSPNSRLRFCFYEDLIYFVERAGYDSPDNADTALYRMEKDGSGLTLLQDHIVNAAPIRFITYLGEGKYNIDEYDIDIYDDIIYLLNNTCNPQDGESFSKSANLYFKLEKDGSVSRMDEENTLYGRLPDGFSLVPHTDRPTQSAFPSLPYFMRNYGYLFVKDTNDMLWRIDPVNGSQENLSVVVTDSFTDYAFSGDTILFYSCSGGGLFLFRLSDRAIIPLYSYALNHTVHNCVFTAEQGFYYCYNYYYDSLFPDEKNSCFTVTNILPDGSGTSLLHYTLPEENQSDLAAIRYDSCPFGNCFYYFKEEETKHSLMRLSLTTPDESSASKTTAADPVYSWSVYPASAPAVIITDEREEKIEPGNFCSVSRSVKKLSLEEKTAADKLINRFLNKEAYEDFEAYMEDMIQNEQIRLAKNPDYYYGRPYSIDFSLTTTCEYMDDDTISFCCAYYEYFSDMVHSSHWRKYYTFDRHTGERLSFEDFIENTDLILTVAAPYVENKAEWGFSPESILEPDRFSLSADGYTVYFSPYEIGPYASGHITVTIPYSAFY